jgi:hypothetical protein
MGTFYNLHNRKPWPPEHNCAKKKKNKVVTDLTLPKNQIRFILSMLSPIIIRL